MSRLILFTSDNCPRCPKAKKIVKEAMQALRMKEGEDWEIVNIDEGENMIEALKYQIASTPSILIDDEVFVAGEIPKKEDLIDYFSND